MMIPAPLRSLGPVEWAMLLCLSVLWGGSYLFIKLAVSSLPPFSIVLGRVTIAACVLAVLLLVSGAGFPKGRKTWLAFVEMGILNNVIPMSLIVFSQQTISAGLASILNAMTPLFTIIIAHFVTHDERLTPRKVIGVLFGLSGVVVLIGPEVVSNLGLSALGEWACLIAAVSYACANSFGRRFARLGVRPMQTAFGQVAASTLILTPLALWMDRPWTLPYPGPAPLLSVLALGVFSTAIAYVIFFRILARSGATATALVTLMIPPSAITMGAMVLGEHLSIQDFVGMALIAVGLLSVNRQKKLSE